MDKYEELVEAILSLDAETGTTLMKILGKNMSPVGTGELTPLNDLFMRLIDDERTDLWILSQDDLTSLGKYNEDN